MTWEAIVKDDACSVVRGQEVIVCPSPIMAERVARLLNGPEKTERPQYRIRVRHHVDGTWRAKLKPLGEGAVIPCAKRKRREDAVRLACYFAGANGLHVPQIETGDIGRSVKEGDL